MSTPTPTPTQAPDFDAMEESNQLLKIFKAFMAKHMEADPTAAQSFPATIALQSFVLGLTVALNGVGRTVTKIGSDITELDNLLKYLAEGASDETE